MTLPSIESLLVAPADAPPEQLLGLGRGEANPDAVWRALEMRLNALDAHPSSATPQGESLRRRLYEAARRVLEPKSPAPISAAAEAAPAIGIGLVRPKRSRVDRPQLTEFDRAVLAELVRSGGWNAESRARLIELAAAQGVSARGLMMVVEGLSEYVRAGGSLLEKLEASNEAAGEIATGAESPILKVFDEMQAALSRELKSGRPRVTVALSLLFGGLTILVASAIIVPLFLPTARLDPGTPHTTDPNLAQRPPATAPASQPEESPAVAEAPIVEPMRFNPYPSFTWTLLTPELQAVVDTSGTLIGDLENTVRRLRIGSDEPSAAVYREWDSLLDLFGRAWPLLTQDARTRVLTEVATGLLYAGDRESVVKRLLEPLDPRAPRRPDEITPTPDLWRSAFAAGALADLCRRQHLDPVVIDAARTMLDAAIDDPLPERIDFNRAVLLWSDQSVEEMVKLDDLEPVMLRMWEQWISLQSTMRSGEGQQAAIATAIRAVVRSSKPLEARSTLLMVAGRLISLADFNTSPAVRELYAFLTHVRSDVPSPRLWVFTSLVLASQRATWFTRDMVVDPQGTPESRHERSSLALAAWPQMPLDSPAASQTDTAIAADAPLLEKWFAAATALHSARTFTSETPDLMEKLAAAALLNAAAAQLERRETDAVRSSLELAEGGRAMVVGLSARMEQPTGQPAGTDGEWARAYAEAARNDEVRLQLLRTMRTRPASDLGPVDAEVFVNEAVRSTSAEVRSVAQSLLIELYPFGPNVALELLDQLAEAPVSEDLSQVIRRITNFNLPSARDSSWQREARLALLRHAISLRQGMGGTVEVLVQALEDACRGRAGIPKAEASPLVHASPRAGDPAPLMQAMTELLRQRLSGASGAAADLAGHSERRRAIHQRLAEGPVQRFIAEQVSALELFAAVAINEQPSRQARVEAILDRSLERRRQTSHALQQALEAERAWMEIAALRFGLTLDSPMALEEAFPRVAIVQTTAPAAGDWLAPWRTRLEGLKPERPDEYLVLAEELADGASHPEQRRLAEHLAGLAGALDRDRLGRSACLLAATLATDPVRRRTLEAMAALLDRRSGVASPDTVHGSFSISAVEAFTEAMSAYRRGKGQRARSLVERDGVMDLLDRFGHLLPGGKNRFLEDSRAYRGQSRPAIRPDDLQTMLNLEAGLLAGSSRSWMSDLLITAERPLVELDPSRLDSVLEVDTERPLWRDGHWTKQ